MKKVILAVTSLLVVFSVSSHADLKNYFVKQADQTKTQIAPSTNQSVDAPFKTQFLNENMHITNR